MLINSFPFSVLDLFVIFFPFSYSTLSKSYSELFPHLSLSLSLLFFLFCLLFFSNCHLLDVIYFTHFFSTIFIHFTLSLFSVRFAVFTFSFYFYASPFIFFPSLQLNLFPNDYQTHFSPHYPLFISFVLTMTESILNSFFSFAYSRFLIFSLVFITLLPHRLLSILR